MPCMLPDWILLHASFKHHTYLQEMIMLMVQGWQAWPIFWMVSPAQLQHHGRQVLLGSHAVPHVCCVLLHWANVPAWQLHLSNSSHGQHTGIVSANADSHP